jgi:hypothetical protein
MVEYKIVISHSGENLSEKVSDLIGEGWVPIGSHQVQIRHQQNRFRGDQHMDTINDIEYSQTLTRETLLSMTKMERALRVLRVDAEMALSGDWDCTTQEGIDDGFNAQIRIIDEALKK